MYFLYVFDFYDGTLDLHSFPTRRSSDLTCEARAGSWCSSTRWRTYRKGSARGRSIRSEEHTSELQSLTNLVCRLLLEKKNITTFMIQILITSNFSIHYH